MRRRLIRIALILLFFPPLLAAVAGWFAGPAFLHPIRRELTPDLIREADVSLAFTGATREDFDVHAPDGALLRGWKVRPKNPNGNWVLLFHGVADNRVGVIGQSEFLLRAGYCVVMMDARAHGASGGPIATYGWLERNDTRAIIDALLSSEHVGARLAPPASSFTSFASSTSLTFTSSPLANPWAPASPCNPRPLIPASKLSSLKPRSPISAKGLTITPVCENSPGSARLSSLPAPGRCCIAPKDSPVFRPRKSHR